MSTGRRGGGERTAAAHSVYSWRLWRLAYSLSKWLWHSKANVGYAVAMAPYALRLILYVAVTRSHVTEDVTAFGVVVTHRVP